MLLIKTAKADNQAILLNQNDKAPYYGVLMSVDYARELEKKSLDLDLYKSEIEKHEGEVPLYTTPDGGKTILIGLGCALLGFLIGSVSH
jgi:hypothetical protein